MTIDRIVHLVAGSMVLLSIALAYFVHPNWMALAAFVGLNLAQSAHQLLPAFLHVEKSRCPGGELFLNITPRYA